MEGLSQLLKDALLWFAALTGRMEMLPDDRLLCLLLLALGLLLCFLGFRVYRFCFAVLCYIGVVVLWCLSLKEKLDWGTLAAGFSVTGCVLGFLAFRWRTLGAVLMPAILAFGAARTVFPELWQALCAAAAALLLASGLPAFSICSSTALFGTFLLREASVWLWPHISLPMALVLMVGIAAAVVQLLMAKKLEPQIPVYRSWAEKLRRYVAEKRRKGEKHASGI